VKEFKAHIRKTMQGKARREFTHIMSFKTIKLRGAQRNVLVVGHLWRFIRITSSAGLVGLAATHNSLLLHNRKANINNRYFIDYERIFKFLSNLFNNLHKQITCMAYRTLRFTWAVSSVMVLPLILRLLLSPLFWG
jgi:hypothetical protein